MCFFGLGIVGDVDGVEIEEIIFGLCEEIDGVMYWGIVLGVVVYGGYVVILDDFVDYGYVLFEYYEDFWWIVLGKEDVEVVIGF